MENEELCVGVTRALIVRSVRRYSHVSPEDLEQEAALAAIVAFRCWRADGAASLATYVHLSVRRALLRYAAWCWSPVSVRRDRPQLAFEMYRADEVDLVGEGSLDAGDLIDKRRAYHRLRTVIETQEYGKAASEALLDAVPCKEVAARHGISLSDVRRVTRRALRAAARDPELRALVGAA